MTDAEKVVKEAMIRWESRCELRSTGSWHRLEVNLPIMPEGAIDPKQEFLLSIETLIMECVGRLSGQRP